MALIEELKPEALRRACDPERWAFTTTQDLEELGDALGQPRAMSAVDFGVGIAGEGYNLFVLGPPGLGKHSLVRQILERRAAAEPVPADWCYVNDFHQPYKPRLLRLMPGHGVELRRDMEALVDELSTALASSFESEEYQTRRQAIDQDVNEHQEKGLSELGREAKSHGLALLRTPVGMVFAPLRDEEVLSPEEFKKLPEEERGKLGQEIDRLQEELQKLFHKVPRLQRERREKIRQLNREVSHATAHPLIQELREKYAGQEGVLEFLDTVEADVVEHSRSFVAQEEERAQQPADSPGDGSPPEQSLVRRYGTNVIVDHSASRGAPVVFEDNPTYPALVGRVEHIPRLGALVTDFNLIKPGALHLANGGYLLLEVEKVLQQPFAWQALKRTLKSHQIKIESLGQALSLVSTYSLEPEAMPLAVKVVLLGDRHWYYLLSIYDSEFRELFKVVADFDDRLERDDASQMLYARLLAKLLRENGLRPFDRGAVSRVIEHSARMVDDAERLSLYMSRVLDLLREADHWAGREGRDVVTAGDVSQAIDAWIYRSDRLRQRIQEEIVRGTILISTSGAVVGQINGLSVHQLGDFSFGRPSRITARVRLGSGELIDIEREVKLAGPLHSKGVMILAGFIGSRYAADLPLSLHASLVLEQSYGGVEGDSASSTELYALLSAIAEVPIRQSLAVTGSVNQLGEVQAIGGVNEKIEGFFDVCAARGLTGEHGVLIPASNLPHLMLDERVVSAVATGRFHVWAVATIDEGIEILTGVPAGERDTDGVYPEGSVNRRVEDRLRELAEKRREFGADGGGDGNGETDDGDGEEVATGDDDARRAP